MLKLSFDPSPLISGAGSACFGPRENLPENVAIAVSGGSDSMALLRLAHWYWGSGDKKIVALTVDHGLRPESAGEAKQVALWCADLGVEHHILNWNFDGKGNLSAAAREGRYRLMADFCKSHGIAHLYTGHTVDDQAETVLMRFARGSGVDGLAGMRRETPLWGVTVMRPFILDETRDSLRAILSEFRQEWIDDPTNDDPNYDRVKARLLFDHLKPLGVSIESLSRLAYRMSRAQRVLEQESKKLAENALDMSPMGFVTLNVDAIEDVEMDTACRVVSQAMSLLSTRTYRADLLFEEQIVALALGRQTTGGRTLGGCMFKPAGDYFNILREPARCAANMPVGHGSGIWDGRFHYDVEQSASDHNLSIGALGEVGLSQISKDYEDFSEAWQSAPYEARLATPGLWQGDVLLSAPLVPWVRDSSAPKLLISPVWSKMDGSN